MRWSAIIGLAIRSQLRWPGRTLLTIVGVALGSGLLVALATVSQIAESRVIAELGKGGPATAIQVAAAAPDPAQPDADNPHAGASRDLDAQIVNKLRSAGGVDSVTPVLGSRVLALPLSAPDGAGHISPPGSVQQFRLPSAFEDTVIGIDLKQIGRVPASVIAGRLPASGSLTEVAATQGYLDRLKISQERAVTILGAEVELIGNQVQANDPIPNRGLHSKASIVGVVAQQIGDGQFLAPIEATNRLRMWALGGVASPTFPLPKSEYSGLVVVASDLNAIHTVRSEITLLGYSSTAPEHLIASVQKYLHVVDIVLGGVGLIALVIATLGIGNSLLVAVRERRQQIGVLKAIGARDLDVVRWFIVEAVVIGLIGGSLGTVLGLAVAYGVGVQVNDYLVAQGLTGIDFGGVPATIVALGIIGSSILALVAGALPAWRAARLPAREALNAP